MILLTLILLAIVIYFARASVHVLQPAVFAADLKSGSSKTTSTADTASLCQKHRFPPYTQHGNRRKVYDLFLFSTELEWLEIRLHELSPYVDYFVIVESTKTFTGLPKPLVLRDNWDRFKSFHPKMLHYVVEDDIDSSRTWDHEDFVRNALLYNTFPYMRGSSHQANDGDVLVISDIDEIPRPEALTLLRQCDFPDRLTLRSHFYYYSFQWLHRGEQWEHPQATVYHGQKNTISPKDLRNGEGGPGWLFLRPLLRWWQKAELWNTGWHCSSCFSTVKEMQTKMGSFSHTPWNTEENRDPRNIVERVRKGLDLFGREGEVYDKIEGNLDVPKYVLEHEDRFGYLVNRDGEDAAFLDYHQN